jgi:biotin synthase
VKVHKLLEVEEVLTKAMEAKENGSTRFCMGAAGARFATTVILTK